MKTWKKVTLGLLVVGSVGGAAWFLLTPSGPKILEAGEITVSEEVRRLDAGEILLERRDPTGGKGVAAQLKAVIEAPVSKVWPTVRDCQHFKEFMPRTAKSELLKKEGNTLLCYVEIKMPWPLSAVKLESLSTIEELDGGGFKRSWKLSKGSFDHNNGSYQVEPFQGDADRTLVTYLVDAKPNIAVPDAILRKAQAKSLPDMIDAIGQRAGAPARKK